MAARPIRSKGSNNCTVCKICILLRKDTASPLSHQMMASSNCFNFTQAFAPGENSSTHLK